MVNPEVDAYIRQSQKWPEEMTVLRAILLVLITSRLGLTLTTSMASLVLLHMLLAMVQAMTKFTLLLSIELVQSLVL